MDKHWDAYCGLSIVHFLAFPECQGGNGPILETVSLISDDDFFSGIEVSRINDPQLRKQVAGLLEQSRLSVDFGVHPVILGEKQNINSLDSAERQRACATIESYLEQAAELKARRFVLLSGPDPGTAQRADASKALVESLQRIAEAAKGYGLEVVLETFDRTVDKRALIGPADEAAWVAGTLRKTFPKFGLLYDMGHMVLLNEKPAPAMGLLRNYLVHVHVGNCVNVPGRPGYGDLHPRFGYPGSANDVPELVAFLDALFTVGYLSEQPKPQRPLVGFEIRPQPGETSAAILASLKRAWREAWPLVSANPKKLI
jgi:sugar phosphate isomerase/epimerase